MMELRDLAPDGYEETLASARAVKLHREQQRDVDLAESLTERERDLIEAAYEIGMKDALKDATRAIGPAAVTVDAASMRNALSCRGAGVKARAVPPLGFDSKLLGIVRSARNAQEMRERFEVKQ